MVPRHSQQIIQGKQIWHTVINPKNKNIFRNTIVTNDENYQYTIGQRLAVSFKDARMVNLRYCSGKI